VTDLVPDQRGRSGRNWKQARRQIWYGMTCDSRNVQRPLAQESPKSILVPLSINMDLSLDGLGWATGPGSLQIFCLE
jgi:hypothetical protein